jgi:hypothetical protein
MESVEDVLYGKMLDMKLVLRDTQEHFNIYSANDLVKLIHSSTHNRRNRPIEIQLLFDLEKRITEIRHLIEAERLKNLMN